MDNVDTIGLLKEYAGKSVAANAVFHVFAMRKRARSNITISSLNQTMKREGFKHSNREYEDILKLLSNLGLGNLATDRKGRIKALVDIKVTLQSIGLAVCGTKNELNRFSKRNKFIQVMTSLDTQDKDVIKESPQLTGATEETILKNLNKMAEDVVLAFNVKGKPVKVHMPNDLNEMDIANLVCRLRA